MPTMEGQILSVIPRAGGWERIETDGRPRFLDTKRPDLVALAQQLMRDQVVAVIEYNERPSGNINPHTNRPYTNYYFEGAMGTAGGTPPPTPATNGGATGTYTQTAPSAEPRQREPEYGWRTNPIDAWRMTLGAAAKLAILTLPLLPVEQRDPESQWRLTLWWANRIFHAPVPQANPLDEPEPQWGEPAGGNEDFGF